MADSTNRMQPSVGHSPQQAPRVYQQIKVRPASGALGAQVTGVDLTDLDDAGLREIEQALFDHLVLFIRDQTLSPDQQKAFAGRLGPLMIWPYAESIPGQPEMTEVRFEPGDTYNFGGLWHSDSPNFERPPMYTLLYCTECPDTGGDTSFANQYLAWETLSDGLKGILGSLKAVNSLAHSQAGFHEDDGVNTQASTTLIFDPDTDQEMEHPVARRHPVTGRRALYVNRAFTAQFAGMTHKESLPWLRYLWDHAVLPEFTCRLHWEQRTLALWDNRCTMHYAHNDHPDHRRVMRRMVIQGERPA